ncbi:delta-class carbonic anhydrase [Thalassospira lucentensis]|uniref:delta-class carbonic anhydrase n=1 Tax=Thalassospira lucentensis TaxID=168935 RepID=UPI0003B3BA08|nr:delta-class carbonic anhydrase [Thalassospira lucentensis]RCK28846.1 hypothetical protein TH1_06870 [Thalassospira lucentensis MCCC 1A00383 = DSM 14000]
MFKTFLLATATVAFVSSAAMAASADHGVPDEVIAKQRTSLAIETDGKGYSPQSPRDIGSYSGENHRIFSIAPAVDKMTLCDIHFHENAEHKGGMFTTYAGNGDGHGYGTGFKYDGKLTEDELAPIGMKVGASEHGDLEPGDTIEIHFVYSTAKATIGNGLGTCLSDAIKNPQLRVEAVVGVLVSEGGEDFAKMAEIEDINGLNQVPNLPTDLGKPVLYEGSTTGPGYNEKGSPFQVTWSVRPTVVKLNLASVDAWLKDNPFGENHAHGVRNLVTNPDLLSEIN